MAKITVYLYELWDPFARRYIASQRPATRRAIQAADGVVLESTAMEVDLECINADGVMVRWPAGSQKTPQG